MDKNKTDNTEVAMDNQELTNQESRKSAKLDKLNSLFYSEASSESDGQESTEMDVESSPTDAKSSKDRDVTQPNVQDLFEIGNFNCVCKGIVIFFYHKSAFYVFFKISEI